MADKNEVKLGEGVANDIKLAANQECSEIGKEFIKVISDFFKDKIRDINFNDLFSKKNQEKLIESWSIQLAKKGLIAEGYGGLPEKMLIDNLHQDGYLDGLYAGYILAMMSLVDNEAEKELILSVRDDIRSNLMGHHYNNRDEFYDLYKSEKYNWIETTKREYE